MVRKKIVFWFCAAIALMIFASCSSSTPPNRTPNPNPPIDAVAASKPLTTAVAILTPTEGNQVTGRVKFTQSGDFVRVVARIQGLQPNAVHGWHIHEFGDLSSLDGTAMGGHYNPADKVHGLPNNPKRHAGDLGNLKADSQGEAIKELRVNNITINGPQNPILGRGLILHAESDDGGQPTGNAGSRIAQGVIGVTKV